MRRAMPLLSLSVAVLWAASCAAPPRPQLTEPGVTVTAMRNAFDQNDVGLFLHTLGRPVLREYSEHVIRVGWSDIRPRVGEFVESAVVVEIAGHIHARDELPPRGFISPADHANLRRVRLRVNGQWEDFLFQLEVDPPPPAARQARGFWIGDRYFVRTEHASPQTYLVEDSPESERTHWRLIFPYHPFQARGQLTARLQERLGQE